jgi:hypothetical protein
MNTKEFAEQFKKLHETEIQLREQFRTKRKELENMVSTIDNHVAKCSKFWYEHIPDDVESFIVVFENDQALKINPPDKDKCFVESYLPFGIDFSDATVFDCR